MKIKSGLLCLLTAVSITSLTSCNDDSIIGGSLTNQEVKISVDSSFNIEAHSVYEPSFDSRGNTMLLGAVDMKGVGRYSSSFVTQLMPATAITIPDSISLDSIVGMRMRFSYLRGSLTGDSLAPCRLSVYKLTKELPKDIQSNFDPTGYYDPSSPLGHKNYTASLLGSTDSVFHKSQIGNISVDMPVSTARDIVKQYRIDPSIFQWPATFAKYFPGLYIENSFGNGCLVNIAVGEMAIFYHRTGSKYVVNEDKVGQYVPISITDSATVFATAPEVLSSNNISMQIADEIKNLVAEGNTIVMSPCGYLAEITIPAQEILDKYNSTNFDLGIINNLVLSIPARSVPNDYGLRPATNLLMVRKCDMLQFFADNSVPDNTKKSFWGAYNSTTGKYTFTSMRQYIVDLMKTGEPVSQEDMEFILVPVSLTTEINAYNSTTYVTACTPFIGSPTLGLLDMKNARLNFTFSVKE